MYLISCVAFIVITCSYGFSGEYWPGSYYTIDENGNKDEAVLLNKDIVLRYRRNAASGSYGGSFGNGGYGGGYSSGGGYSGGGGYGSSDGSAGGIVFDGPTSNIAAFVPASNIADFVQSGLEDTFSQLKNLENAAAVHGRSGGGGRAYSGSFSSGGPNGAAGQGGVLHSRFASTNGGYEKEYVTGDNYGIRSSSSAQGPNGAYSFSSSSTDDNGRVHYQSRAHKF